MFVNCGMRCRSAKDFSWNVFLVSSFCGTRLVSIWYELVWLLTVVCCSALFLQWHDARYCSAGISWVWNAILVLTGCGTCLLPIHYGMVCLLSVVHCFAIFILISRLVLLWRYPVGAAVMCLASSPNADGDRIMWLERWHRWDDIFVHDEEHFARWCVCWALYAGKCIRPTNFFISFSSDCFLTTPTSTLSITCIFISCFWFIYNILYFTCQFVQRYLHRWGLIKCTTISSSYNYIPALMRLVM